MKSNRDYGGEYVRRLIKIYLAFCYDLSMMSIN